MRLVEWNCRSKFAGKLAALEALGPDVAVLSEAPLANPRPSDTLTEGALSWASVGEFSFKGLAVAGFGDVLAVAAPAAGSGTWSVVAMHPAGFQVIGIWSCPPTASGRSYGIEVLDTLEAHAESIATTPTVIAGDFNIEFGGAEDHRIHSFAQVVDRMAELGLVSAYHAWAGVEHGAEPVKTHFYRTHEAEGFHIDFVFVPASWVSRLRSVEVGSHRDWVATGLSDHVPIVVDVDL